MEPRTLSIEKRTQKPVVRHVGRGEVVGVQTQQWVKRILNLDNFS